MKIRNFCWILAIGLLVGSTLLATKPVKPDFDLALQKHFDAITGSGKVLSFIKLSAKI